MGPLRIEKGPLSRKSQTIIFDILQSKAPFGGSLVTKGYLRIFIKKYSKRGENSFSQTNRTDNFEKC